MTLVFIINFGRKWNYNMDTMKYAMSTYLQGHENQGNASGSEASPQVKVVSVKTTFSQEYS